ncbi:MAG: CHASE2 domain-containing protein, partial [Longimicrobiales bacterium]
MRTNASAIRREQIRILLTALPAVVVAYLIAGLVGSFSDRPWIVTIALLPLGLTIGVLGWPLVRHRRLLLGGGFLGFFVAYCLFFSIAAATRVLDGKRAALAGFEAETPSNVLRLSRIGDWHYLFARKAPPANDLVVVTLPSFEGQPAEEARFVQATLIKIALNREAKGIAFDYHVEQPSAVDGILCSSIGDAERAGIPVVYGYRVEFDGGNGRRRPMAPQLAQCIARERQGALTGLREADGFVRMVPTSHARDTLLRSFSHRIAALLAGTGPLPDVGLVQYVQPPTPPRVIEGEPDSAEAEQFRDRFVLVGSSRPGDVHATPFGRVPGVMIHALAAHSLRAQHYIRRLDALWLLPGIVLLCYLLTLLQARGGGVRPLLAAAAILSVATMTAAAIAVRAGLVWIDASYPLVAIWGLTGLLSGGAM